MITLSAARPEIPVVMRRVLTSLAVGIGVTALADWLFYLHQPGITVVIFALTLAGVVLLTNRIRASGIEFLAATAIMVLGLLPSLEDFGVLAAIFAIVGTALFALVVTGWPARAASERLYDIIWTALGGPVSLVMDTVECAHAARDLEVTRHGGNWLKAWIVPLGVGGAFLGLFAAANPVIANWFTSADTSRWANIDMVRVAFWLLVLALIWGFLQVRPDRKPSLQHMLSETTLADPPLARTPGVLFGKTAILRSLVLFNALFAVQTMLDVTYLWGGATLPAGMTYAAYAHRGAYPLIVTSLLAGAFVLAAMRPRSDTDRSRPIRTLVYLWIAQNVMLVTSSILRLDLYVDVYSLTRLRCVAFVWMLLVAISLVLIMARIVLDRSNGWLVWSNAGALALTLYVCSFVNFPGVIADFNVAHSQRIYMAGLGQPVDVGYLCDLGPAAIPALDALIANRETRLILLNGYRVSCRDGLYGEFRTRHADWRAFTWRSYRLQRYLDRAKKPPEAA